MATTTTATNSTPANMATPSVFVKFVPATGVVDPNNDPSNPTQLRQPNAPAQGKGVATQVTPRFDLLLPGEPIAFDLELQEYSTDGGQSWKHRLGWIGGVNSREEVFLDTHVKYAYDANIKVQLPPKRLGFGVTWERLKRENGAQPAHIVEGWCVELFKNRTVVVHAGYHDTTSFRLTDPFANNTNIVDTQVLWHGRSGERQKRLKDITWNLFKIAIQEEIHTPVEDATATMKIYLDFHPYDRAAEALKWVPEYRQIQASTPNTGGSRGGRGGRGRGGHGGRGGRGGRGRGHGN